MSPYRLGLCFAVLTALLVVWTALVRDDGNAIGPFMVVIAASVSGFAVRFHPAGLARAMLGLAAMQTLLALLLATAPSIAHLSGAAAKLLRVNGGFVILWLIAALCFRISGQHNEPHKVND